MTLPMTLTSIVFFLPIASDRFPKPSAPKNNPHINIQVDTDEIGMFASSQTQWNCVTAVSVKVLFGE